MKRRDCLLGLAAAAAHRLGAAHDDMGPVDPPLAAPDVLVTDQRGQAHRLRPLLEGRVTLVQTIFTGCSSICPLQGALFAEVQGQVLAQPPRQKVLLLSIGVDVLGDTPQALARWLADMGARMPDWMAVVPRAEALAQLKAGLVDSRARTQGLDAHSERVWCFDARGQMRWRTGPLPSVGELTRVLRHFAA